MMVPICILGPNTVRPTIYIAPTTHTEILSTDTQIRLEVYCAFIQVR